MGAGACSVAGSYPTGNPGLASFAGCRWPDCACTLWHITFNADQTVSGVAINMLAPYIALFACRLDGAAMSPAVNKLPKLFLARVPLTTHLFSLERRHHRAVLALDRSFSSGLCLYRTAGPALLRWRAPGYASETLGISVRKTFVTSALLFLVLAGFMAHP